MLYSFDIFDTIITRVTATPQGVFALMQERLINDEKYKVLPRHICSNFYLLRTYAETLAHYQYMRNGVQEVTLPQIYSALALNCKLSAEQLELLMLLEVETELECVCPIEKNIEIIKELLADNQRVVLISDMYLDRKTIKKMLAKADSVLESLPLYLSSEWKKNKWNGTLFKIVKEQENIEYEDWIHMGDNAHSDAEVPKKLGIQTKSYSEFSLLEEEIDLLKVAGYDINTQMNMGAARLSRIMCEQNDIPHNIGCSYAGPILYPYVRWIIAQSEAQGIDRLYFIARDGYILKKMADIIIRDEGLDIKTAYIYGSRKAWRMASFSMENSDIELLLQWSHERKILTIDQLADVFEIESKDFSGFLPDNFLQPGFQLNRKLLNYCKHILNSSEGFKEFIVKRHEKKRRITLEYLRQVLDVKDDNFAFVELGGSGYTQECLSCIMSEIYDKPIRTFFFKMDRIEYNHELCDNRVFFTGLMKRHIMIEMICRAPHGQTLGYYMKNEKILPYMDESEEEMFQKAGYNEYVDGIIDFTRYYNKSVKNFNINSVRMDIMYQYLQYLSEKPSETILDFFGDLPNNETGRDKRVSEYAPRLTRGELRKLFLYRTTEPIEFFYKGTYLEYSLLRCTNKDKRLIEFYKKNNGRLLGKLCRMHKRLFERSADKHREKYMVMPELLTGNIALYAAGKVGQAIYRQIRKSKNASLTIWVDENSDGFNNEVKRVEALKGTSFDIIIISILNKGTSDMVKKMLIDMGIPEYKIFMFCDVRI